MYLDFAEAGRVPYRRLSSTYDNLMAQYKTRL